MLQIIALPFQSRLGRVSPTQELDSGFRLASAPPSDYTKRVSPLLRFRGKSLRSKLTTGPHNPDNILVCGITTGLPPRLLD